MGTWLYITLFCRLIANCIRNIECNCISPLEAEWVSKEHYLLKNKWCEQIICSRYLLYWQKLSECGGGQWVSVLSAQGDWVIAFIGCPGDPWIFILVILITGSEILNLPLLSPFLTLCPLPPSPNKLQHVYRMCPKRNMSLTVSSVIRDSRWEIALLCVSSQ